MTVASPPKPYSVTRAWTTVVMLFFVQTINRADKAVLGLAATAIMAELAMSPERFGLVASSFYFLYAATGIFVGYFFASRYRPRLILAVLLAVWSLSQLPIVFAASFATLLVGRIILGAGEGNGTPTCINACHEWFPPEKRNLPTSVVMAGALIGSLASAPLLTMVIEDHGWHWAFAACAIAGFVVLFFWLLLSRDGPYSGISSAKDGAREGLVGRKALGLLRDRTVYGSYAMHFSADWVVGFTLTWLPTFATLALGFTLVEMGWLLSVLFLGNAAIMMGVSWFSQWLLGRGVSNRAARGWLNVACLIGGAIALILAAQPGDPYFRLVMMGIGVGLPITTFTLNPAMMSDVLPARHRNRLLHILLSAGTIGSMLAPWLTGKLVGDLETGNWALVLWINAAILIVGGILAFVLMRPDRSRERMRLLDEAAA